MTAPQEQGTEEIDHNHARSTTTMTVSPEQGTAAWEAIVNDMDAHIEVLVERGFSDRDEVISDVLEAAYRSIGDSVQGKLSEPEARIHFIAELLSRVPQPAESMRSLVEHRVDAAFAAQVIEEGTWPAVTDNDCLNSAFEDLEARGILARQDFMDCPNCAHNALMEEAEELQKEGAEVRGFVFYDWDNTEEAMNGNGVCLWFGSTREAGSTKRTIGREVVEVLQATGLCPIWSGSPDETIEVPMVWQRRVVSQPYCPDIHATPDAVARARCVFRTMTDTDLDGCRTS
jgi:hypothetical protein